MFDVFVGVLPAAIGVALSPVGIIEVILVLFSKRARVNGPVFLLTIVTTVFAIPALGAFVLDVATKDSSDQPSTAKGWVLLAIGVLLLVVAARNWKNRADQSMPKVLDTIVGMGPTAVFVLALGVAAFNPKNLIVLLSAGTEAGASGESAGAIALGLLLFTVVATLPFSLSVGYMLFGGEQAKVRLDALRAWLIRRNKLIMAVILGILAVVLIGQGLTAIS